MNIVGTATQANHIKSKSRRRLTAAGVFFSVIPLVVSLVPPTLVKAQCKAFDDILKAYAQARQPTSKKRGKGSTRERKSANPAPVEDAPDVTIPGQATKFDEFGDIKGCDTMARLDNFAIQLQNEPNSTGAIVTYSIRVGRRNFGLDLAKRARDYLINVRGIEASRILAIDGGHRNNLETQLWITR